MARWEHELTLAMNPGKADLAHADLQPAHVALAHADLQPAHVDISDIAAAAEGGARSISFVMREVHARLSERLCRAMHIQGALLWSHPKNLTFPHLLALCQQQTCTRAFQDISLKQSPIGITFIGVLSRPAMSFAGRHAGDCFVEWHHDTAILSALMTSLLLMGRGWQGVSSAAACA